MENTTYQVKRYRNGFQGTGSTIAVGIETFAEACELALRLTMLQETELGGHDEFTAMAE